MLALILAAMLNHPTTAAVAWHATAAVESTKQARTERHARAESLGRWLDSLDGERIRAAARYSPFADDEPDASPFEVTP
jgi:hypothetical protein